MKTVKPFTFARLTEPPNGLVWLALKIEPTTDPSPGDIFITEEMEAPYGRIIFFHRVIPEPWFIMKLFAKKINGHYVSDEISFANYDLCS